jgi:AcrR family transcriptional regulator
MALRAGTRARAKGKKMTSRQLQALRTKDNIYESALRVIGELGYENTSIEAIITAAGVSTGSFYTYFNSKEHVLLHTYEKFETLYRKAFKQVAKLPFPGNVYAFVQTAYSDLELRGKEIMYGVTSNILSADFKVRVRDKNRAFFKCLRSLIESGIQNGRLPADADMDDVLDKMFIVLTGVEVHWCLSDFACSLPDLAVASVRTMVNGMLSEKIF